MNGHENIDPDVFFYGDISSITTYRVAAALEAAILLCSETFMLTFIVTPKSFSFTVIHKIVPQIAKLTPSVSMPCVFAFTFLTIKKHLPFFRPYCQFINVILQLLCIPIFFLKSLVSSATLNQTFH